MHPERVPDCCLRVESWWTSSGNYFLNSAITLASVSAASVLELEEQNFYFCDCRIIRFRQEFVWFPAASTGAVCNVQQPFVFINKAPFGATVPFTPGLLSAFSFGAGCAIDWGWIPSAHLFLCFDRIYLFF